MKTSKRIPCADVRNQIETYIDGDLAEESIAVIDRHVSGCGACRREMALARRVHTALHALPPLDAPADVAERVFAQIRMERHETLRSWLFWEKKSWLAPAWCALGVAAAILLIWMGVRMVQTPEHIGTASDPEAEISLEELALAEAQTKWALGYISQVSRRTGLTVRDDIIGGRVAGALQQNVEKTVRP
ncbi:MAG: zf-HC2 domain-containing protein [candidate division Zixibacteria bacterium]|nr:zf-HC2 domain-containing protein [candidate division Zixibacteria bacterium]